MTCNALLTHDHARRIGTFAGWYWQLNTVPVGTFATRQDAPSWYTQVATVPTGTFAP